MSRYSAKQLTFFGVCYGDCVLFMDKLITWWPLNAQSAGIITQSMANYH